MLEKYFCCCWCKSGPLTCVISLPCSGYVPGQIISVVTEIDNISNVEVNSVHLVLKKVGGPSGRTFPQGLITACRFGKQISLFEH